MRDARKLNVAEKFIYEIDGKDFASVEGFYDAISSQLLPGIAWGRNLDAFNEILRGEFGTPRGGFVLRWKNSRLSMERLGYPETVRQLQWRLSICHAENQSCVLKELAEAQAHQGATVFDWLTVIIRTHGAGGAEPEDGVELEFC
jgi:RNAse (barnase) inhibitor barstar